MKKDFNNLHHLNDVKWLEMENILMLPKINSAVQG